MASNIYSQSGQVTYGIKIYTVDTNADKEKLPTKDKMGSRCYVIEDKKWYILNGNNEWVPFVNEDGSIDAETILSIINGMSDSEKSQLRSELGEPELYFVTFTYTDPLWNADKTIIEINTAYLAGKIIVFKFDDHLQFAGKGNEGGYNYFGADILAGSTVYSLKVMEAVGAVGSSYTVAPVDSAFSLSSENPVQNKLITAAMNNASQALENKVSKSTVISSVDAIVTIEPANNTVYKCGELTSLTITSPPASGAYSIVFTSGSTPTVTTIPATILGLEDFAAEANTMYEINILDNRAVVGSWAVSST